MSGQSNFYAQANYSFLAPGFNFLDLSRNYTDYDLSLNGSDVVLEGTVGVDRVYVPKGIYFDFTNSRRGMDEIYLDGYFSEYSLTANGTTSLTLASADQAHTEITLAAGDKVFFKDGSIAVATLLAYAMARDANLANPSSPAPSLPTLNYAENSLTLPSTTNPDGSSKTYGGINVDSYDPRGAVYTLPDANISVNVQDTSADYVRWALVSRQNIGFTVNGTLSMDKVYVPKGAEVYAHSLGGSVDQIYLTGYKNDYYAFDYGNNYLALAKGTEKVLVSSEDKVIFADGSVLISEALTAARANSVIAWRALSLDSSLRTPGLGPVVSVKSGQDAYIDSTETSIVLDVLYDKLAVGDAVQLKLDGSALGGTRYVTEAEASAHKISFNVAKNSLGGNNSKVISAVLTPFGMDPVMGDPITLTLDNRPLNAPVISLGTGVSPEVSKADAVQASGVVRVFADVGSMVLVTFTDSATPTSHSIIRTILATGAAQAVTLLPAELGSGPGQLQDGSISVSATEQYPVSGYATPIATSSAIGFTLDTVAPAQAVPFASVVGNQLILNYDSLLDSVYTAAPSYFHVINKASDGTQTEVPVSAVNVNGKTVELTLASNIASDAVATVSFVEPTDADDPNTIQDLAGNDAPSFADQPVANLWPSAPEISSVVFTKAVGDPHAGKTGDLVSVLLTFNEPVTLADTVDFYFSVGTNGSDFTVSYTPAPGATASRFINLSAILSAGVYPQESGNPVLYAIRNASFTGIYSGQTSRLPLPNGPLTDYSFYVDNFAPTTPTLAPGIGVSGIANLAEALVSTGVVTVTAEWGSQVLVTFHHYQANSPRHLFKTVVGNGDTPVPVVLTEADLTTLGISNASVTPRSLVVIAAVTDAAGNSSGTDNLFLPLDPYAAIPSITLGAGVGGGATAAEATASTGVLSVTAEVGSQVLLTLTDSATPSHSLVRTLTASGAAQAITLAASDLGVGASRLQDGDISVKAIATDTVGNVSASSSSFILDTTAPSIFAPNSRVKDISVLGKTLTLNFDEPLDSDSTHKPAASAFAVMSTPSGGSATAVDVNSFVISGSQVVLTLASPIPYGATATVAYTDPSSNNDTLAIQDVVGNDLATFAARAVINNTPVAPRVSNVLFTDVVGDSHAGSAGDDVTVVLTFSQPVTVVSSPVFNFRIGSSGATFMATAIPSTKASNTLTLSATLPASTTVADNGKIVLTSVTLGEGNIIGSTSNATLDAAYLDSHPVTDNIYRVDNTFPALRPMLALGSGVGVAVSLAEATVSSGVLSVTADSGCTVWVTFTDSATPTAHSLVHTVSSSGVASAIQLAASDLGQGANQLQDGSITVTATAIDMAGHVSSQGSSSFTLDTVAPALTAQANGTAALSVLGNKITLNFDDTLDAAAVPLASGFVVNYTPPSGMRMSNAVTDVAIFGKQVVLTLTTPIPYAADVTLSYTDASSADNVSNVLQDLAGNETASFSQSVTNLSTQRPTVLGVVFSDAVGNPNYGKPGDTLTATVRFSEPVVISGTVTFTFQVVNGQAFTGSYTAPADATASQTVNLTLTLPTDSAMASNGNIQLTGISLGATSSVMGDFSQQNLLPSDLSSPLTDTNYLVDSIPPPPPFVVLLNSTFSRDIAKTGEAFVQNNLIYGDLPAQFQITLTDTLGHSISKTSDNYQWVWLTDSDFGTGTGQLSDGTITMSVSAIDAAGNSDTTTSSFTLKATLPSTPLLTLGTGISDGATLAEATASSGVLMVQADAGSMVRLTFSDSATPTAHSVIKTITALGNTIAKAVPVTLTGYDLGDGPVQLKDGTINVTATAFDRYYNKSSSSLSSFFLLGTDLVLTLGTGVDDGASLSEATASSGVVTVRSDVGNSIVLTFSDSASPVHTIIRSLVGTGADQAVTLSASDLGTGASQLRDGVISVIASSIGNSSSSSAATRFVLDTLAPTTLSGSVTIGFSADTGTVGDFITTTHAQTITVRWNGNLNAPDVLWGSLDDGLSWSNLTDMVSGNTLTWTGANLLVGSHTLQLQVKDQAGNEGPVFSQAYQTGALGPSLRLGAGVADGANRAEATARTGVVTVNAESGSSVVVTFTDERNHTLSKTLVATGADQPVLLGVTDIGMGLDQLYNGPISVKAVATSVSGGLDSDVSTSSFNLYADMLALGNGVANGATAQEAIARSGVVTLRSAPDTRVLVTFTDSATPTAHSLVKTLISTGAVQAVTLVTSEIGTGIGKLMDGTISVNAAAYDTANNIHNTGSTSFVLDTVVPTTRVDNKYSLNLVAPNHQYAILPVSAAAVSGDLTLEAWVYSRGTQDNWARIFDFGAGPQINNVILAFYGGKIAYSVYNGSGNILGQRVSKATFSTDVWHHVALTVSSGSNPIVTVYVDGVSAISDYLTAAIPTFPRNAFIGHSNWANDPDFNGSIRDVRIYDMQRTQAQVSRDMRTPANVDDPTLIGYYPLENTPASGKLGVPAANLMGGAAFSIVSLALSADTGVAGDFITNTAAQTITAKLTAPLAMGEKLWVSLNDGSTWFDPGATVTGTSGTSVSIPSLTLLSGTHNLQFAVRDVAGNQGPVTMQQYTLDTTAPTAYVPRDVGLKLVSTTVAANRKYVTLPQEAASVSGTLTLEAWVFADGTLGQWARIFDLNDGTSAANNLTNNVIFGFSQNKLSFTAFSNGTYLGQVSDLSDFPTNSWHHVAVTVGSGNTPTVNLFIDDVNVRTGNLSAAIPAANRHRSFIGHSNVAADPDFNGTIRDVRIYDSTLTQAQIGLDMAGTVNTADSNLKGYYPLTSTNAAITTTPSGKPGVADAPIAGTPVITVPTLKLSNDTGYLGDFSTNTRAQTITALLKGTLAADEKVWGSVDEGSTWTDLSSFTSGNTVTWTGVTLGAVGVHTMKFEVRDLAGNAGLLLEQGYRVI